GLLGTIRLTYTSSSCFKFRATIRSKGSDRWRKDPVASLPLVPLVRPTPLREARSKSRPASEHPPGLSVVMVNYHQWGETADLVRQLGRANCVPAGRVEIVVVDNHSPSNPISGWLRRRREVSLRRWGKNRGFARAVNEACRLSRGAWFVLLN